MIAKFIVRGVPYKITAFHKWEKMMPVINCAVHGVRPNSTACSIGLFNHRQTAMYRGRRSVLRTNRIGNVPKNDWPIVIQLQDCNGPRKRKDHRKDHAPIASQLFQLSLSSFFPCFLSFFFFFYLWPQAPVLNYPFFFLIRSDLKRHFGATSASLRIEDRASTQLLCSRAFHRL